MRRRAFVPLVLALAVGLAAALGPYASSRPDGLNRVAADHGFVDRGQVRSVQERAPLSGYAAPGVADARVAKGVSGFAGTLVVFGLGYGLARVTRRRSAVP